jgi:hypothetical protein
MLVALCSALLQKSIKGGLVVVGNLNLGGSIDPVHNAINVAELAISKGAFTLLVPVSARKQLNDLPDDMITKVNILYCTDSREALLKAIVEWEATPMLLPVPLERQHVVGWQKRPALVVEWAFIRVVAVRSDPDYFDRAFVHFSSTDFSPIEAALLNCTPQTPEHSSRQTCRLLSALNFTWARGTHAPCRNGIPFMPEFGRVAVAWNLFSHSTAPANSLGSSSRSLSHSWSLWNGQNVQEDRGA